MKKGFNNVYFELITHAINNHNSRGAVIAIGSQVFLFFAPGRQMMPGENTLKRGERVLISTCTQ